MLETKYGASPVTPPAPPGYHFARAGFHFLQRIDYDGRSCGLEVYQWQPGAKLWCRPNEYSSGRDLDLIGYEYVAVCPTPPFVDELESVKRVLSHLKHNVPEDLQADLETFRRLVSEHLMTHPQR